MKVETYGILAKKTNPNQTPVNTGLTKEEFIRNGRISKTLAIVGFFLVFISFISVSMTENSAWFLLSAPGVVCIVVCIVKAKGITGGYKMLYLDPAMQAEFGSDIHYPGEGMTEEEVLSYGLFKKQPNNVGKRVVTLNYKGIPVTVTGISTYTIETFTTRETDDDGYSKEVSHERNVYRFDGACVVLKTPKTAPCRVRLVQKGFVDDSVLEDSTALELYTRRDERFRDYIAYGEDENTALQILNASFLTAVESLSQVFPKDKIAIDWSGDRLCIAFTDTNFLIDEETGLKDEHYTNTATQSVYLIKAPVELFYGMINF